LDPSIAAPYLTLSARFSGICDPLTGSDSRTTDAEFLSTLPDGFEAKAKKKGMRPKSHVKALKRIPSAFERKRKK
jgi:hypothetical protein